MILYLMRHGDAAQSGEQILTEKGRVTTENMSRILSRLNFGAPGALYASPLIRAQQTAQIVTRVFAPTLEVQTTDSVASGNPVEIPMAFIASLAKEYRSLMLIGHDPLMSKLVSALIMGSEQIVFEMSKSAVAVVELTRFEVPRMRGILRAFLPPEIVS
jgi:phosphohistidine phosphatase